MKLTKEEELKKLIRSGADGGFGEFEEYLPKELAEMAEKNDVSFQPEIVGNKVIWNIIK